MSFFPERVEATISTGDFAFGIVFIWYAKIPGIFDMLSE
jgi:hypothetical protein